MDPLAERVDYILGVYCKLLQERAAHPVDPSMQRFVVIPKLCIAHLLADSPPTSGRP
jgi:hypothetical protein